MGVLVSTLADALRRIVNAERKGRRQVLLRPCSRVIIGFLQVMQQKGYIGNFTVVDDKRRGKVVVELLGRINKCGVVSPRFDIALNGLDQTASMLLPARQFGHVVLTTSAGLMSHNECIKKHASGKIVGYFF